MPRTFTRQTNNLRRVNFRNRQRRCDLYSFLLCGLMGMIFIYVAGIIKYHQSSVRINKSKVMPPDHEVVAHSDTRENKSNKIDTCSFRKYPPRRYYGLNKKPTPDFLQNVSYIWGEAPQLIAPKNADDTLKLCVNQSEWYKQNPESLPFADGTNPSVLKLKDNPRIHQDFEWAVQTVYVVTGIMRSRTSFPWGTTRSNASTMDISIYMAAPSQSLIPYAKANKLSSTRSNPLQN